MVTMIAKMSLELALGVCMKLFIENGRIHYADLINDYFFWLPGVDAQDGTGVEREVLSLLGPVAQPEHDAAAIRIAQ